MRSTEELPGTLVLLRPDDQPELNNKIGTIVSELLDDNSVIVNLRKSGTLTLSVTELFVLRDPEEIQKGSQARRNATALLEFRRHHRSFHPCKLGIQRRTDGRDRTFA